jgi:hypothetical protein
MDLFMKGVFLKGKKKVKEDSNGLMGLHAQGISITMKLMDMLNILGKIKEYIKVNGRIIK